MSIQRFLPLGGGAVKHDRGEYVTYADSQRTNQATVRTTNEHE